MTQDNNIKPIVEFLLWDNCNNNCSFCFQKNKNKGTVLCYEDKIKSINAVINFLNNKFVSGSHAMFIGGELFDNIFTEELDRHFINLLKVIVDKMAVQEIDILYINTNLIYKNLDYILFFLNLINKNSLMSRLKFTTSYDIHGRFKDEDDRQLFLKNIITLKGLFPELNIIANAILTKHLCTAILEEDFSVKDFWDTYKVHINVIPYIVLNEQLAAAKEDVLSSIKKVDQELDGYLLSYVHDFNLKQPRRLLKFNGCALEDRTSNANDCGHSVNFSKYCSEGTCFVCDINKCYTEEVKNG